MYSFSGISVALRALSMSDLMMRNQIIGLRRAGMSCEEISVALEIDSAVVRLALEAVGGSVAVRKEARAEKEDDITDDVSEAEAKEMMGIIKNIARDEDSGVYARLNAAKYAHGAKRGYHKRHLDMNVGSGELLLKISGGNVIVFDLSAPLNDCCIDDIVLSTDTTNIRALERNHAY